ncbi:MAG TPA: hypothetical protein PK673_08005 [Paludibacteraceae bacterium]|nr:hypothetical protein [Paludibacteraceae bacterium]
MNKIFTLLCCIIAGSVIQPLLAQTCADYQTINVNNAGDNCSTATDAIPSVNNCRKVCVNMDNLTPSAAADATSCGYGTDRKDFWLKLHNPYTELGGIYDGSVVLAWKQLPDFPHNPTIATHIAIQGQIKSGPFPLATLDDVCGDLSFQQITCVNDSLVDVDHQFILPAGTIPTLTQLEDVYAANPVIANTTLDATDYTIWLQIEDFEGGGGTLCFEMSAYQSGFSCSDPSILTYSGAGTTQTQTVSRCLCKSAQNGGYFNASNTPCSVGADYNSTTAFYQINAPYSCNDISVDLTAWNGTGDVNVTILSDVVCPEVDINGTLAPGQRVTSSTIVAQNCVNINSSPVETVECVPAGVYWVLISGAADKSAFSADITVSQGAVVTPGVEIFAKAYLEGAYNGSMMTASTVSTPLAQPFFRAPWIYEGTESVVSLPTNAIDWVLLEVRDANDKNIVVAQRAALLLSNGDVVDTDGSTGVNFGTSITAGTAYHLAIKHRNHLAVVSANTTTFPNTAAFDFSNPNVVQNGSVQLKNMGTIHALKAGDTNANGIINYADFNVYAAQQGQSGYLEGDCNLDGTIDIDDFNLLRPNTDMIGLPPIRE